MHIGVVNKKNSYSLLFTNEMFNHVIGHKAYLVLDEYFAYHQISIAPKDWYKIIFVIN
jgi:hypothetical protein